MMLVNSEMDEGHADAYQSKGITSTHISMDVSSIPNQFPSIDALNGGYTEIVAELQLRRKRHAAAKRASQTSRCTYSM